MAPNEKGMIMMACARSLVRAQSAIYFATIGEKSNIRVTMTLTRKAGAGLYISPDRGMTEYDYFLQRKSELYCYNRNDVKVMVGWIVTAPQD